MPLPATIEQPTREQHRVSLEPVRNAIASMMLLAKENEMPGTGAWLAQMREKLTATNCSNISWSSLVSSTPSSPKKTGHLSPIIWMTWQTATL